MASAQSRKKKSAAAKKPAPKAAKKAPAKRASSGKSAARKPASGGSRRATGATRSKRGVQENPVAPLHNPAAPRSAGATAKAAAPRKPAANATKAAAPRKTAANTAKAAAPRISVAPDATNAAPRKSAANAAPARDAYDAYDLPQASARGGSGGGSRRRRRRDRGFGTVNLALLLAILTLGAIGVWRTLEYRALAEMKALVARETFYPGTSVEGVDVSDMTLSQAIDYWNRQIEPGYRQAAVVLDDGTRVTALELGYASNYEDVLAGAWNAGRSGSLRQRYLRATTGSAKDYRVERVNFDDALVRQYVADLAAQVDAGPQDAHVASFNPETYEFEFAQEVEGRTLDQEALVNAMESALNAGGGTVERRIATIEPAVRLDNVAAQYGMITSAVTNASSSSENRISNIRLAVSIINGTRLRPGEQFSFNQVVGERTASRGFKVATAYSSGAVTEEVGGGICQVSTTLFNAAVKADLQIDERHSHSLTVSYVDLGKDAAVDWGGKDLKFTNTSGDDVYIACAVSDDRRIHFGIFGRLLPNGETITVEGVKTGKIEFETQYQTSFELYSGQTRKLQEGKDGYTATTYKIRWDAEGNEIEHSELCKSRYQATPEIIEYGP